MNFGDVCEAVTSGSMSPRAGIEELTRLGCTQGDAAENILILMGGGDIITLNDAGEKIYMHSGKTVREVRRLMRR